MAMQLWGIGKTDITTKEEWLLLIMVSSLLTKLWVKSNKNNTNLDYWFEDKLGTSWQGSNGRVYEVIETLFLATKSEVDERY